MTQAVKVPMALQAEGEMEALSLASLEEILPAVTKKKTSATPVQTVRKDVLGEIFTIVTKAAPVSTIARKGAIAK